MITSDGRTIIAKYLLNQAPEFVSHIAVGVGGNALPDTSTESYDSEAKCLDFEAFRVPVLSKGLLKEDGVEKLIFKAELPTDQRFRITELGLYPAENNILAERYASKTFISFNNTEPWRYVQFGSGSVVPYLNKSLQINDETNTTSEGSIVANRTPAFFMNSDDPVFNYVNRVKRREAPRYLGRSLAVSGNFSGLNSSFVAGESGYYIENSDISLDLGKNLPTDQVKLAFSLISRSLDLDNLPTTGVRIRLELINNTTNTPKAYVDIEITSDEFEDSENEDKQKRYKVVTKNISDFTSSSDFSWSNINLVRIYLDVVSSNPSEYFISLDGIRLENISTINPLYALIAAENIKTPDGYAIVKQENSTSYIEYRFGLGT